VNGFKLNIPEFQDDLQPKEFLDQVAAAREVLNFKEVKINGFLWSQGMMFTLCISTNLWHLS
jgi:hypothetical protein